MKQLLPIFFLASFSLLLLTAAIQPSGASCLIVEKGKTVKVKVKLYANTQPLTNKKWGKLKQEKRDEVIAQFNASVESGNTAPFSNSESTFEVTDVQLNDGLSSYTVKAVNSGYEYQTTNYCQEDTMHLIRNKDVVYSIYQGDTLGLAIQGVQRIPNNLKVGDRLPAYRDFMMTIPKTWTKTVIESVKAYSYTTSSNKVGWMQDSYSGKYAYGTYRVTETHDVYKNISHKVSVKEQIKNLTIHYYSAVVTGKETVQIGSQSYEAFVIDSQTWSKTDHLRDYDAEEKLIQIDQELSFEKFKTKLAKKSARTVYTNEQGYAVTYRKEWFVPGYGVVRSATFDQWGGIQSLTESELM